MAWSEDGKRLVCGTAVGTVLEVLAPEPGSVDTSKTFEVHGLLGRKYTFKPPKPPKKVKKKAIAAEGAEDSVGGESAAPGEGDGPKAEGGAEGEGDQPPPEEEEEEEEPEEEIVPAEV